MLIAHIDHETGKKQTLIDHAIKTSELAADFGRDIDFSETGRLLGLLHDVGKADRRFQHKILNNTNERVTHSSAGAKYLSSVKEENAGNRKFSIFLEILSYVLAAHHGMFDIPRKDERNKYINSLYRRYNYDNSEDYHYKEDVIPFIKDLNSKLKEKGHKDLGELTEQAFEEFQNSIKYLSPKGRTEEKFYQGLYVRLFLSILKSADIIDTINSYDTVIERQSTSVKEERVREYVHLMEQVYKDYGTPTTEINKVRTRAAEAAKKRGMNDSPGIYRLDLPTGAGKTQISLRYGLQQLVHKGKSRFIYITAYLSVLEQNADVIRDILKDDILEHHSNIVMEPNVKGETEKEKKDHVYSEYLMETWDDLVVVSTMVQFFNTLIKGKSDNIRRFASLINSVIILDEVQSLPIEVTYIFNLVMNFLKTVMKCTVVHCTATQPKYDSEYIKHRIEYGGIDGEPADIVLLDEDERKIFDRTEVQNFKEGKRVGLEELSEEVLRNQELSTLIILNTKSAVHNFYDEIRESTNLPVYFLTTELCPEHRRDRIREMKERLEYEPIICVSTQLIEAGVDIDFQQLVRSYAGIDSLIQAMGRCNREGKWEKGRVILANVGPRDEKLDLLPEIRHKKEATTDLLKGEESPVDVTILNKEFYEYYFANYSQLMTCPVKSKGSERDELKIFDLLSENENYILPEDQNGYLNQSFRTAGYLFNLINDNTVGVIVYYKDSEILIEELVEEINTYECTYQKENLWNIRRLLRKLQPYTVNMYNTKKLDPYIMSYMDGEIKILMKENYSDTVGVTDEVEFGLLFL